MSKCAARAPAVGPPTGEAPVLLIRRKTCCRHHVFGRSFDGASHEAGREGACAARIEGQERGGSRRAACVRLLWCRQSEPGGGKREEGEEERREAFALV